MVSLSSAVLMRAHRFLLEIHAASDVQTLRRLIPVGLARLIACDRAALNEFNLGRDRGIVPFPVPAYWERLGPVITGYLHEHSLGNPAVLPTPHRAVTFGDRRNEQAWTKSVLYNEYYLPAGIGHQLGVYAFKAGSVRFLLNCNRWNRDFSLEDRALLELISPHVECAWRNATALDRLRANRNLATAETASSARACSLIEITSRESEILHWIREGKRNSEIAIILGISPRTVGKHVEHVLEKLGVETRTAAAQFLRKVSDQKGRDPSSLLR